MIHAMYSYPQMMHAMRAGNGTPKLYKTAKSCLPFTTTNQLMKFKDLLFTAYPISSVVLVFPAIEPEAAQKTRFIVQFEPSLDKDIHKLFSQDSDDAEVQHVFVNKYFLEMSFNMEDFGEETMNEIRRRQGVKNVWRADNLQKRELALPENVKQHLTPDLTSAVK